MLEGNTIDWEIGTSVAGDRRWCEDSSGVTWVQDSHWRRQLDGQVQRGNSLLILSTSKQNSWF